LRSKAVEEEEANVFARELLMPASFLEKDMQGVVLDIESDSRVKELAKKYGVSLQVMALRLHELGYFNK
jgi:Zn-dependent peptidase ImmA (M78 family)